MKQRAVKQLVKFNFIFLIIPVVLLPVFMEEHVSSSCNQTTINVFNTVTTQSSQHKKPKFSKNSTVTASSLSCFGEGVPRLRFSIIFVIM